MKYLNVNVGTFHAVCDKILRVKGLLEGQYLIPRYKAEQAFKSEDRLDFDDILSFISFQKNYNKTFADEFVFKGSKYSEEELRSFFKDYEAYKKEHKFYDFDDILINCYKHLKENPNEHTYEYVLVDEHQDSNLVQNLLLKEMCTSENIFCVFDYRQAVYSFRGGDTEYCMNFTDEWDNATVINLDTNYRSTDEIVTKANEFIEKYYGSYEHYSDSKSSITTKGRIKIDTYGERDSEAFSIADSIEEMIAKGESINDIAVLFRLNTHAGNLEFELKRRGIPYESTNGGSFFKRKEIVGVISYLRLINNPHDDIAFENMFNFRGYPLEYFSKANFNDIKQYAGMNDKSYFESLLEIKFKNNWQKPKAVEFGNIINKLSLQHKKGVGVDKLIGNVIKSFNIEEYISVKYCSDDEVKERLESLETIKSFVKHNNLEQFISFTYDMNKPKSKTKKDTVKLMSIHASKGLEFKHVFVIGIQDTKFPHVRSDILEEARLFYVAVTRPKENLYLSQIGTDNQFVTEYFNSMKQVV